MRILSRCCLAVLVWYSVAGPAASEAQINQARDRGVAWLLSNQTGEGRWKSASEVSVHATSAAIDSLKNAGINRGHAYSSAVAWLSNATPKSADALSRQIIALSSAGSNTQIPIARLLASRTDSTKAWGAYPGYQASFPDTALALDAILLSGTSYADTGTTLGFVAFNQNTDGGWASVSTTPVAGQSAISPTAHNIAMLSRYKALGWSVDSYITAGVNWLLSKQKGDGGFTQDPSASVGDPFETALVLSALKDARAAGNAAAQLTLP